MKNEKEVMSALKLEFDDAHSLDQLVILNAGNLSESELKNQPFGDVPCILIDVDDSVKEILFSKIGIMLKGYTEYMLIRPLGEQNERMVYHIIDSCEAENVEASPLSGSGIYEGPESENEAVDNDENLDRTSDSVEDSLTNFARAVGRLWGSISLDSVEKDTSGPETYQWLYSKSYPVNASGTECSKGKYKPPKQTLNGYVTFTFQAFLDEAVTGNFQWLYMNVLGAWDTNTMKENYRNHRGWGNGAVGVSVPMPSGFNYYDCSPKNANNVTTVTTQVGFSVGYQTGQFDFSKSSTQQLSDWRVVLNSINNWTYAMANPYNGNSSEFPDKAIKYNAGSARHEIKSWPALTTNTFDWDTMSVWRTDRVLKETVTISPKITYRQNFIFLKNSWPSWSGCYWVGDGWPRSWTENFRLDMSVVS